MNAFFFIAIASAVLLIGLLIYSIVSAKPEMRKAYVLPSVLQIFAASIVLVRGGVLPYYIPPEIVNVLSYFFSLYLTFTSAISIAAVGKRHRALLAFLWVLTAIGFWIVAITG